MMMLMIMLIMGKKHGVLRLKEVYKEEDQNWKVMMEKECHKVGKSTAP